MKVACLFSGGKDSNFALYEISQEHDVVCLISMISNNKESYMFQTTGNNFIDMQAECLKIDLIKFETLGEKEKELVDLKKAIILAKDKYGVEGIVTGAIKSVYQGARIQKICNELNLWCFNPLWQIDEDEFINRLIDRGFLVKIIGIFSYPFTKEYVGRILDKSFFDELEKLRDKFQISVAGEGGEFESFVLDSPLFKKKLEVLDFDIEMSGENSGLMEIRKVEVLEK